MAFGAHSMIKDLINHDGARAVIERHLPGATAHPMLSEVMYMTLGEVAGFPEAGLSRAKLQALVDDLAKIQDGG